MNEDIKYTIKSSGLYLCRVAQKLGLFEHAFYRLLQKELNEENRNAIYKAIDELVKEKQV